MDNNISKKVKHFWGAQHATIDIDFNSLIKKTFSEDFLAVKHYLKKYHAKKILDLGCGLGYWSIALAKAGFRVKAVDISSVAINKLQRWARNEGLSIDTEVCLAQRVNLISEEFDAVICNSVLDHMPYADAVKVIENIKKILKKSRIAFISFDGEDKENENEFVVLSDGTRKYIKGKRKGMLWRFYTNEEIKILCKDMEIAEFIEKCNGKRIVWIRKSYK